MVKFLAARSLTFICIRPVLSVLFHSFSFCSFMLYNRHGRRQTFAMSAKFSAWMNDYFHNFKGFSLRISFLGSRAWWIGLLLSIIHFKLLLFQTSKNLTFFPSSILHNINWLPPPTSTSLNRKTYFVQWSPTWPWFTLFRYLGFLLN